MKLCAERMAMLIPLTGCARPADELDGSNVIPMILSGLSSSYPACSKQVLKGLCPFSQHANHQFVQIVLSSMFLKVIWNDSISDCMQWHFLTG